MAVAQIASLLILTALTLGDPATRAYRECKGQLQLPTSAQLPEWCQKMRFEVADCIVARLGFEDDDGSVSLRGRVLLETYKRSGDDDLYTDLKLYHYGCVYNSWHNFVDDKCFKAMMSKCVNGSESCYYNACESVHGPPRTRSNIGSRRTRYKSLKGSSAANFRWTMLPTSLMIPLFWP